jgi:hypothetical protein
VVDAVAALAASGPASRVGLRFAPGSRHDWSYRDDDLAAYADGCVLDLPPVAGDDVDALVTRLATEAPRDRPIRVYLTDRYLVTVISHAVGDSRFVLALSDALLIHCRTGETPTWAGAAYTAKPLPEALGHTFRQRSRVTQLLSARQRMHARRREIRRRPSHDAESDTVDFRPQPVVITEYGRAGATRALQEWTRHNIAGAAHFAVVLAAVHEALIDVGIPCSPSLHMVYDLRRYLPRGRRTLANFVAGLDLPVDPGDPLAVTAEVTAAAKTGHPLAAAGASVLLSTIFGNPAPPASVAARPQARLALSYVGQQRLNAELPWAAGPDGRRYSSRVEPAGPTAITLLAAIFGGRLCLSASFHASVFDPGAVRAALQAAHSDTAGLVERSLARRTAGTP